MPGDSTIRSAANPLVKKVRSVLRGDDSEHVVLEGERLVRDACAAGIEIEALLIAEGMELGCAGCGARVEVVRRVDGELLARVSGLSNSPGILALCRVPTPGSVGALDECAAEKDALVVVCAGVQDPGNLGAIARVAEAAGANALVTTSGGCRPWNPKALRGSMGSLLRVRTIEGGAAQAVWERLEGFGFRAVVACTRDGEPFDAFDWSGRVALWLSAESGEWPPDVEARIEGAKGVTIPMAGGVESLNVAVAAGVLLFAAGRNEASA